MAPAKNTGFSDKVPKLESQYNKTSKEITKEFNHFASIIQEVQVWVLYTEVKNSENISTKHHSKFFSKYDIRHRALRT